MAFLYNFFIQLYILAIKIASIFNSKAAKALKGRKNWKEKLSAQIDPDEQWIWMHCSSLGEFEQGRPVFEALKKKFPDHKFALSFFSPSGYEIRKNYEYADVVFYLPFDTKRNARELAKILQPKYWILVKYDYWFNHLNAQYNAKTKIIVISAIFRPNQIYFKLSGQWMTKRLKKYIHHFFVQDKNSKKLLEKSGIHQVSVAGDTRLDRVKSIAKQTEKLDWVEKFKAKKNLIVIGSSWAQDEKLWIDYLNKYPPMNWKIIFAPHEINIKHIQNLRKNLESESLLFSDLKPDDNLKDADILVVDSIGMLSKIYASADLAYVGGGFNKSGVHNTLEPAVFGVPVIIGPNFKKFNEVKQMRNIGIVHSIKNYFEFEQLIMNLFVNDDKRVNVAKLAQNMFEEEISATQIIVDALD